MLASKFVKPVIMPPGREKLSTKPVPIGSETDVNTIGMPTAACRTASVAGCHALRQTNYIPRRALRSRQSRRAPIRDGGKPTFACWQRFWMRSISATAYGAALLRPTAPIHVGFRGVRCKKTSPSWGCAELHQCIRPFIGAFVLRAIMDISAPAVSLADQTCR
jgi:hypothetical protein